MIENTSKRDGMLHLLGMMSDGQSGYIDGEAAGQRQLVNSDRLPTTLNGGTDADFEAVGFTFGDPDKADPMFRPATLPEGWTREGSDHAMWSYIVDQHGRRRVGVFYKASFYDRKADMYLETPYGYLTHLLYHGGEPVLDDTWLTREVAVAELGKIRDSHLERAAVATELSGRANADNTYWNSRIKQHQAEADEAEAMRVRLVDKAVSDV